MSWPGICPCEGMFAPDNERRRKTRFPMRRELRYKWVKQGIGAEAGHGETVDIASGGVSFATERPVPAGAYVELSISWPVLLDHSCPMRLNVFGRVIRAEAGRCACTIEKYEFRTQARGIRTVVRIDSGLHRFLNSAGA